MDVGVPGKRFSSSHFTEEGGEEFWIKDNLLVGRLNGPSVMSPTDMLITEKAGGGACLDGELLVGSVGSNVTSGGCRCRCNFLSLAQERLT